MLVAAARSARRPYGIPTRPPVEALVAGMTGRRPRPPRTARAAPKTETSQEHHVASASENAELIPQARTWLAEDPDPDTRAELEGLLAAVDDG